MAAVVAQLALTMQSNAVIGMHTLTLWGSCVKVFTQFFLNAVDNQWAEPGSFSFAALHRHCSFDICCFIHCAFCFVV